MPLGVGVSVQTVEIKIETIKKANSRREFGAREIYDRDGNKEKWNSVNWKLSRLVDPNIWDYAEYKREHGE